jgi:uncharacterized DUF497 family protein
MMARRVFEWDDPGDEEGNVVHIARHGVTTQEAEYVVLGNQNRVERSRSSSHWMTFGSTRTGKYLLVVWYAIGENPEVIRVVTAYDVERPRPKGGRR